MQSRRVVQIGIAVIIAGVVAFVFLSGENKSSAFFDNKPHTRPVDKEKEEAASFNFDLFEKDVVAKLEKPEADKVMVMQGRLKGRGAMNENLLILAQEYEKLHQPALAGHYYEELTRLEPKNENIWFGMGNNYFDAEQSFNDQTNFKYFVGKSYQALQKVLEMDPNSNYEAMTDQAVNILESSNQPPMEGVGLLRKVVQLDSNNRKALNYLGLFSMQSNQFDKAIVRFQHLTALGPGDDPNYPYYYRSLGQAYEGAGKKEEAIEAYKKYKSLVTEETLKQEADKLIESIHK